MPTSKESIRRPGLPKEGRYPVLDLMRKKGEPLTRQQYLSHVLLETSDPDPDVPQAGDVELALPVAFRHPDFRWDGDEEDE